MRPRSIAAVALSLSLVGSTPESQGPPGSIRFVHTNFQVGPSLAGVEAADVDGDADLDLVVGSIDGALRVYMGAGDGTFAPPLVTMLPCCPQAGLIATELNGDACADLVRVSGDLQVWTSNCDGTFALAQTLSIVFYEPRFAAADFDGNGTVDLVATSEDFGVELAQLYSGNGDGTFAAWPTFPISGVHLALEPGDVDQDGLADLVALVGSGAVLHYAVPGGGLCCTTPLPGNVNGSSVLDWNADGRTDLAVSTSQGGAPNAISVYTNSAVGDFSGAVTSAVPVGSYALDGGFDYVDGGLFAEDFDGDGRRDLAGRTGPELGPNVAIARGHGDGAFSLAWTGGPPDAAHGLSRGDLDNDGRPDLVASLGPIGSFWVLLNRTTPSLWVDLGQALAGSSGMPLLSGTGRLAAGSSTSLELLHGAPSSPTVLVAGSTQLALPILGGVLLPAPELLVFGLTTTAHGTLAFPFNWPSGIPSGATIYFQAWTADAGAVQGWSASNGLAAHVP